MPIASIEDIKWRVGQEVGVSDWILIDQARIDAFAGITEDPQFIHIDPEAAAKTPFGGTVAHGFLTLSLLSRMAADAMPRPESVKMGVNYGFERVRYWASAGVRRLGPAKVELTLHEGRKHQVKRMLDAVGHPVTRLHRSLYAGLALGELEPGRWRELELSEVDQLRTNWPGRAPARAGRSTPRSRP